MHSARSDKVAPVVTNSSVPRAPDGHTQGRRFMPLLPDQRRTEEAGTTSFKTFIVRFAYPLMPEGLRVETGSRDTHKAIGKWLTAVKAAPMPPEALEKHLAAIGRATRPLTGSDSKLSAEVFKQCLEMQLKALPMEELKQLSRQIGNAVPDANTSVINSLGDMIHAECTARLRSDLGDQTTPSEPGVGEVLQRIDTICDEALSALANDPATAEDKLRTLEGRTLALVETYGLKRRGTDEHALSTQLLKDIFVLRLLRNEATTDKLLQVLLAMPPTMRAELRAAPANRSPDAITRINDLLDQATARKHDELEASLIRACEDFEASVETPDSLEQQSAQLSTVIAQAKALDSHCNAHKASTGRGTSDAVLAAFGQARESAARLDMPNLDPAQLSHQALHQLDNSFKALEITDHATRIPAEKGRRKEQCNAPFHLATAKTLSSLAEGDLATALQHLQVMQQCFAKALAVHLALGERANDMDGRSALFERLLKEFLSSQPAPTVRKWASALQSDQVLLLAEALEAFGREGRTSHHQDLGQMGTRLTVLRVVLNPPDAVVLARHRGQASGALNDLQVRHATQVMDEPTRRLLHTLTGSDPHRMGEDTQGAMKDVLDAITKSVRDDAPDAAWNEITRDIVRVAMSDTDDNHRRAMDGLLDASIQTALSSPGTHFFVSEERVTKAKKLRDQVSLTTAQMRGLAKLLNTDFWKSAKVDKTLASSEHTPVRLPDGSPLLLDTPENDDTYRITQGSDGQLNVIIERVQSKALDTVNLATGQRAAVNKSSSVVTLSVGFTLQADGSLSLAAPVSCHAHIEPKATDAS